MTSKISPELEDLIKCGCCHSLFNDNDAVPKIFDCRHYFCLKCVNSMIRESNSNENSDIGAPMQSKSSEVYCIHCWKRTEINGENSKGENLPTHKAILYLSKYLNTGLADNMRGLNDSFTEREESAANASNKNIVEHYDEICHKPGSESLTTINSLGLRLNQNKQNSIITDNNFGCNGLAERQFSSGENCLIHAMPNTLWCNTCNLVLCRGCAAGEEHRKHIIKNQIEAKEFIQGEIAQELQYMHKSMEELHNLMVKQRNFLLKILECCTALKSHIEMELVHQRPTVEMAELHETMTKFQLCLEMLDQQTPKEALSLYASVQSEKSRLTVKQRELFLQYKLNEGMRNCSYLFDYDIIKQILMQLSNYTYQTGDITASAAIERKAGIRQEPNGLLLLTNYCVAQMYSRQSRLKKSQQQSQYPYLQQQQQSISVQHPSQRLHLPHYTTIDASNKQKQQQCSIIPNNLLQTMISNINMPPGLNTGHVSNEANTNITTNTNYGYNPNNINNNTNSNHNHNNNNGNGNNNSSSHSNNMNNNNNHNSSTNNRMSLISRTTTSYAQALLQNQSTNRQHHPQELDEPSTSLHHAHALINQQQKSYSDTMIMNTLKTTISQNVKGYPDLIAPLNANLENSTISSATIPTIAQASATALNLFNHVNTTTAATTNMTNNYFCNSSTINETINGLAYSLNQLQQQQEQQQQQQQNEQLNSNNLLISPNMHIYPIYYFNIEINSQAAGRILIEVRNDVAPKMAKNFNALATNELGFSYKGCHIFQCWENESIITGDFEHNNGRGGRSVYDECYFMPDDTKILAVRGAVGMRRSQRRHDNLGLVGSQFRIILREMRCFTGIFAFVIDGLELVDKISQTGDTSGKPRSNVVVVNCGKYQIN